MENEKWPAVTQDEFDAGVLRCGRSVRVHNGLCRLSFVYVLPAKIQMKQAKNVLGTELEPCGTDPMTGFFRDGCCNTGGQDHGLHVVCSEMTAEFLEFSRSRGNDLLTPNPLYSFPGLKPGDRWCLCAARWKEAFDAGKAPPVVLGATHVSALEYASLEELTEHAVDPPT